MAEYIEREAAIGGLDELERTSYHNSVLWPDHVEECRETLRSIPAADVRPVVRGKWEYDHWCEFKCSNCGAWSKSEPYRGRENFCPNCGADMREES